VSSSRWPWKARWALGSSQLLMGGTLAFQKGKRRFGEEREKRGAEWEVSHCVRGMNR